MKDMFALKSLYPRINLPVITLMKRQNLSCLLELSSSIDKEKNFSIQEGKNNYCTMVPTATPYYTISKYVQQSDIKEYDEFLPKFVDSILKDPVFTRTYPCLKQLVKNLLEYNIPCGWRRSPFAFYISVKTILKLEDFTDEILEKVLYMSYIIQTQQWFYQLLDDMADDADTRDNKMCWYKKENVGKLVCFDAALLSFFMRLVLKQHFSDHPQYLQFLHTFSDIDLRTIIGQRMDCWKFSVDEMDMQKWVSMVEYKTAYFFTLLPFKVALHFTNYFHEDQYKVMEQLLLDMGLMLQVMNDSWDSFPIRGDSGTNGTDIKEGRSSWLVVKALELADTRQYNIIKDNYGKDHDDCVNAVLDVYHEIGIRECAEKYATQFHDRILKSIQDLPEECPKLALLRSFDILHKGVILVE